MKFSHSFPVETSDIDDLGHVNNVAYLRWVQDVAVAHWVEAATAGQREKFYWVVIRHELDYKKPAFAGDQITATTWVGKWTGVTCERFTQISRGDVLLASGRTVWCMIDRVSSKPAKIGEDLKFGFI